MTIIPNRIKTATRRLARRLRRDRSGLAMVEFGFAAPLVLGMGMFGTDTAYLVITHLQVSQIAMQVADNASRIGERDMLVAQRVFESDVNETFVGAEKLGENISIFQQGRVIISSLQQNAVGGQTIRWQRCRGAKRYDSTHGVEGVGATGTAFPGMGAAGRQITASVGTAVMFVEIAYDYRSLTPLNLFNNQQIVYTAAFNVRDNRDLAQLYNSTPAAPIARCNVYSAARPA